MEYIGNFFSYKNENSSEKLDIFSNFCSKHRLWVKNYGSLNLACNDRKAYVLVFILFFFLCCWRLMYVFKFLIKLR